MHGVCVVVYGCLMARARIPPGAVVDTAIELVDREGFEALNLSTVAATLGVGPSALYGHVGGLDGLRDLVTVAAIEHLTTVVRDAAVGVAGPPALVSMGYAYRDFAHRHSGQYASTLRPPTTNNTQFTDATQTLQSIFARVYLGCGLPGPDADLAANSARSAIHGFIALELVNGTTPTADDQYAHLLNMLQDGLATLH